ncbi:MAG: hypothetical protein DRG78_02300 [Epsilonproteobacteria bacterium]|nr:MAG: hypothetical protein DRG78_02300 [Campylobacterota bacterium]
MKVTELITKLQSLPLNADILCYTEDENLQVKGNMFRILDIDDVSLSEATKIRMQDTNPSLKFGKSESSEPHVMISVTSDF